MYHHSNMVIGVGVIFSLGKFEIVFQHRSRQVVDELIVSLLLIGGKMDVVQCS